jgi:hypothetical protein
MADELNTKDIQQALDGWRDSATERAERPDWFFARQHARVMSEISARRSSGVPRLAWAGIVATVAVAASLMFPGPTQKQVQRQLQTEARQELQISDHDLMLAVEQTLNAGTPSSLEPATLLADEMNQALVTQAGSRKIKENKYEN